MTPGVHATAIGAAGISLAVLAAIRATWSP
jgi:hypothetical protein